MRPRNVANASDTWPHESPPQLLNESSEDMSRLSALVASLNTGSGSAGGALAGAVQAPRARAPRSPVHWWAWVTLGAAAIATVVVLQRWDAEHRAPRVAVTGAGPTKPAVDARRPIPLRPVPVVTPPVTPPVDTKVATPPVTPPVDTKVEPEPPPVVEPEPVEPPPEPPQIVDDGALKREVDKASKLYMSGRLKEALAAAEAALELDPHHAPALLVKANVLIERKDFEAAKTAAEGAIASDRMMADAWLALGVIEQERGITDASIAAYERFLELAPKSRYAASIRTQLKQMRPAE